MQESDLREDRPKLVLLIRGGQRGGFVVTDAAVNAELASELAAAGPEVVIAE